MAVESTKKRLRTTFKSRVEKFWTWFPEVAKRFEAALVADNPQPVVDEVSAFMASNMPASVGLWVAVKTNCIRLR